jgi:hypothetical protein
MRAVGRDVVERLNQPGQMPTTYANPIPGLRLFHGSPHDFDRFSMSKIGTGEGAQAYGQGLYFAENEGIARGYRDALTDPDAVPLQFDGRPVNTPWNEEIRERWPDYFSGLSEDDADAMEELLGNLSQVNNMADIPNVLGGVSSRARTLYSRVVKPKLTKPDVGAGRMYEVEINANPEDFINYDAPLSAQSLNIQRQFGYVPRPTPQEEVAAYELAKRESPNDIGNHPAVQDIYRRESGANAAERNFQRQVTGGGIDEAARISLSEAGIPGVRYLDAGSRGTSGGEILGVEKTADGWKAKIRVDNRAGVGFSTPTQMITTSKAFPTEADAMSWAKNNVKAGSRNYVVFDENLIEIVRKYGIAGAAALLGISQADVAQAMQQQQQQQPQGLLSGAP